MNELLTINEVASRMGLKPETVLGMLKDGRIQGEEHEGINHTKEWRVTETAVNEALNRLYR